MSESHQLEDEATLYVLGRLDAGQRREFEAELARSAELRQLVDALEDGAVALAMSAPRREPPRELWSRIEKELNCKATPRPVLRARWGNWWRHGWAAAAACLVGWIFYAVWVNSTRLPRHSASPVVSETSSTPLPLQAETRREKAGIAASEASAERDDALRALQARLQEITALRWQLADLTNQMIQLSHLLAQQQLLLSESSRLRFFQFDPSAGGRAGEFPISTNLQRALFLAVARELGWAPADLAPTGAPDGQIRSSDQLGVDFVDLRPGSHPVPRAAGEENPGTVNPPETSSTPWPAWTNAVPGFVSGTNAVMAFDPGTMPTGTSLMFLSATASGQQISLGTATPGSNPTVVAVPFGGGGLSGGNITVIAVTPGGASNVLGQFPIQPPPP